MVVFICGHYVRTYQDFLFNPVLPALKYGQAMEMETANVFFFFELMKKSVLFWQNKSFYCRKVWLPNNIWLLWKCMRWNRMTFVNKLRKTKSGKIIKNNYCFTQCILQMAATNRNLCYFVVWAHGKVIDTLSFGDIMWKDIKEKLIDFYKDFYLRNFLRK